MFNARSASSCHPAPVWLVRRHRVIGVRDVDNPRVHRRCLARIARADIPCRPRFRDAVPPQADTVRNRARLRESASSPNHRMLAHGRELLRGQPLPASAADYRRFRSCQCHEAALPPVLSPPVSGGSSIARASACAISLTRLTVPCRVGVARVERVRERLHEFHVSERQIFAALQRIDPAAPIETLNQPAHFGHRARMLSGRNSIRSPVFSASLSGAPPHRRDRAHNRSRRRHAHNHRYQERPSATLPKTFLSSFCTGPNAGIQILQTSQQIPYPRTKYSASAAKRNSRRAVARYTPPVFPQ